MLADIGMRAYYDGFAAWIGSDHDETLALVVSGELTAYWPAFIDLVPGTSHRALPACDLEDGR